jgi:hypothetical protein
MGAERGAGEIGRNRGAAQRIFEEGLVGGAVAQQDRATVEGLALPGQCKEPARDLGAFQRFGRCREEDDGIVGRRGRLHLGQKDLTAGRFEPGAGLSVRGNELQEVGSMRGEAFDEEAIGAGISGRIDEEERGLRLRLESELEDAGGVGEALGIEFVLVEIEKELEFEEGGRGGGKLGDCVEAEVEEGVGEGARESGEVRDGEKVVELLWIGGAAEGGSGDGFGTERTHAAELVPAQEGIGEAGDESGPSEASGSELSGSFCMPQCIGGKGAGPGSEGEGLGLGFDPGGCGVAKGCGVGGLKDHSLSISAG